jgi:pyruvate,orthophosphate dikinase
MRPRRPRLGEVLHRRAGALHVDVKAKTVGSRVRLVLKEGDIVTLNGTRGHVYLGTLPMMDASENPRFQRFMAMADKYRTMGVRTNADTPEDARTARGFGAEGIGLFRTEHMFYGAGSDQPLFFLRKMILSKTAEERRVALTELYPFVKASLKGTMEAMEGLP